MSIARISISNCKSLKNVRLDFSQLTCLLGENESGKSNILKAIKYFYDNLTKSNSSGDMFDRENSFSKKIEIEIWFDATKVRTICGSQLLLPDTRFSAYYNSILRLPTVKENERSLIGIKLVQTTPSSISWYIFRDATWGKLLGGKSAKESYEQRKLIERIFPLYYVDTRQINLHNWNDLWKSIGSLVSITTSENKSLADLLPQMIQDEVKCLDEITKLKDMLERADVKVKNFDINEYRGLIAQLGLHGAEFSYKNTELSYRSDGKNSYNYLVSLIKVVNLIAYRKTRSPVIIIDEPEMSWHSKYVDSFTRELDGLQEHLTILMSTHSSRLVKNLLSGSSSVAFYRCFMKEKHTRTARITIFNNSDDKVRAVINDDMANVYFAKALVIVEGATECELLRNRNLRKVFPTLEEIDVFEGNADENKRRAVSPTERNLVIPYLSLLDMDKLIEVTDTGYVDCKKLERIRDEKEIYTFGAKREASVKKHNRIDRLIKQQFQFTEVWKKAQTPEWAELIQDVKTYAQQSNTFVWETTIEGAIVNPASYEAICQYFKLGSSSYFEELTNQYPDEKVDILRYTVSGKPDNLLSPRAFRAVLEKTHKDIFRKFSPLIQNTKTGWCSSFFDFFLTEYLLQKYSEGHSLTADPCMRDQAYLQYCRLKFSSYFSELSQFLRRCNSLIEA